MPVPSSINDLSTTASSNSPPGNEQVFPQLKNYLRFYASCIAILRDGKAPLASPTFTDVVTSPQFNVDVNFTINLTGGDPRITADSGDYISYSRGSDIFAVTIGGVDRLLISAADGPYRTTDATTNNGLIRKSQFDALTAQATTTARGTLEIATSAETVALTDSVRAVVPSGLGAALAAQPLLGASQTWQVVTGSRAGGATYTNSTGRPIQVLIALRTSGTSGTSAFVVDFTSISNPTWSSITSGNLPIIYSVVVPNGSTYRCDLGGATVDTWSELR